MRDSNYKSISNNRAAVTITTSLYDRRALDVTSDKPLVNSLNHLTYLVSSSAKVRETLANDGGIERLIEILHECHNCTYNLNDNIFNSEKKLLTAWKWTLAFQCLVLIGTRGTEKIRQKVVRAGMLPIIATVLDNYLTLYERTFFHANTAVRSGASTESVQPQAEDTALFNINQQPQQPPIATINPQPQQPPIATINANPEPQPRPFLPQFQPQPEVAVLGEPGAPFPFANVAPAPLDSTPTTANTTFNENSQPRVAEPTTNREQTPSIPFVNNDNNANNVTSNFLNQIDSFSNSAFNISNEGANSSYLMANHSVPPFFNNPHASSLTSDDYDGLSVDQLFKLIRFNSSSQCHHENHVHTNACGGKSLANNDIKRRYLIVNIIKKLREEKEEDLLDDKFFNDCDYDMDKDLQFLSDMYLQEDKNNHVNLVNPKVAPRNFTETGVVIPRDDDIVWSLQLLAYISKYPHLKEVLQNTHLIIDMSIRDKQLKLFVEKQMKMKMMKKIAIKSRPTITPKSRKSKLSNVSGSTSTGATDLSNPHIHSNEDGNATTNTYLERFNPSASNSPQMLNDINSIQNDEFILDEDKFDLCNNPDGGLIENAEADDDEFDDLDDTDDDCDGEGRKESYGEEDDEDEYLSNLASGSVNGKFEEPSYLSNLYDCITDAESIENDLSREIALFHISDTINRYVEVECKKLRNTIINKRLQQKSYLQGKWNYDTYTKFDVDDDMNGTCDKEDSDYDDSLVEYKKVNLFPMVEKFTFLAGTDMYYWSGVIMRNSCRRNDFRGGVRQCGNLECGKWEKFPREFLKCRRCKRTKYCSRDCQMKAWHCHRNWCIPSNSSNTGTNASSSTANYEGGAQHNPIANVSET